jgi:polyhydroxyalkanoate synthesis repressor PhaR
MASETRLAIGQARMRRQSAVYGRILGMWALACQLKGLPVCSASIVRERRRRCPGSAATADKTVAALKKNRVCCPTDRREPSSPMPAEPVTIKKYANRRLYNTGTSTYVTLEDLAAMVKAGEDFIVHDAKTGEDITRQVLAQIIFEQENKEGQSLLPIAFLRQLIRFYGDSMQMLVPRYLEVSIDSLTREQEKFRQHMAQAFGGSPFGALEDQVRRNMEMFERAFAMFTPFARREGQPAGEADKSNAQPGGSGEEINDLKRQMEEMQKRLDRLSDKDKT